MRFSAAVTHHVEGHVEVVARAFAVLLQLPHCALELKGNAGKALRQGVMNIPRNARAFRCNCGKSGLQVLQTQIMQNALYRLVGMIS